MCLEMGLKMGLKMGPERGNGEECGVGMRLSCKANSSSLIVVVAKE